MKNKSIILFFTLAIASTFFICNDAFISIMCGEPEGLKKAFIDSINTKYKDELTISHVPCYSDYMQISLKGDYNEVLIDSLKNAFSTLITWAEFHVYDKNGKLIRGNTGSM